MNDYAIDVRGLVKRFGSNTAVDGVDIRMPRGAVWGFLGPNGSGKTTTIRIICGLLKATKGSGSCLGFDIAKDAYKIKIRTGYMTQRFSFWADLTIRENLAFVARMYRLSDLKKTVDATLDTLGLRDRQHQLAGALSGGWKQRLALAAVTMHKPELLLLDEPTAGVDPQARRDFWNEIHRLAANGMTVLVSTHYMDEAERCDHIVYLANGKLIAQGKVSGLIEESGLVTYRARGDDVRRLSGLMKDQPGVEYSAYFGSALHVSGTDRHLLEQAVRQAPLQNVNWEEVLPDLEDVFIALKERAGSDTRVHA